MAIDKVVSDPLFTGGVVGNFGMTELIAIGGAGYAAYQAYNRHNDTLTALLVAIPGALLLNNAAGAKGDFSHASRDEFSFGNFDLTELATVGALVWGGVRLITKYDNVPAAVGAFAAAAIALYAASGRSARYL